MKKIRCFQILSLLLIVTSIALFGCDGDGAERVELPALEGNIDYVIVNREGGLSFRKGSCFDIKAKKEIEAFRFVYGSLKAYATDSRDIIPSNAEKRYYTVVYDNGEEYEFAYIYSDSANYLMVDRFIYRLENDDLRVTFELGKREENYVDSDYYSYSGIAAHHDKRIGLIEKLCCDKIEEHRIKVANAKAEKDFGDDGLEDILRFLFGNYGEFTEEELAFVESIEILYPGNKSWADIYAVEVWINGEPVYTLRQRFGCEALPYYIPPLIENMWGIEKLPNLKSLTVDYSRATHLKALAQCDSLEYASLYSIFIDDPTAYELPETFLWDGEVIKEAVK